MFVRVVSCALALTLVAAQNPVDYATQGQELTHPVEYVSSNGVLDATITFGRWWYQGVDGVTGSFWTRAYNGGLPGPTLRFRAGDTVNVQFNNALEDGGSTHVHNTFNRPNHTNYHTHGLHVSPQAPSDSVFIEIAPGETYNYVFDIPSDHHAGINWYHAHRHGSTAIQVGGGASGAMIVEDEYGDINPFYIEMPEKLLMLQQFPLGDDGDLIQVATASGDTTITGHPDNIFPAAGFILVNGYSVPTVSVQQNKWYRFRIVYGGSDASIDFTFGACTVYMIAKDGIYLRDDNGPRLITAVNMYPGNRLDVAIMCTANVGTVVPVSGVADKMEMKQGGMGGGGMDDDDDDGVAVDLVTITVIANTDGEDSATLPDINYNFPGYLTDLTDAYISDTAAATLTSNRQTLEIDGEPQGCTINGGSWVDSESPLFQLNLATVQEWVLDGTGGHPFHIHVQPFQIVEVGASTYYQVGDWHDLLGTDDVAGGGNVVVRFQFDRFAGDHVLHCHILPHEDLGCMAFVNVSGTEGDVCKCGCGDNEYGCLGSSNNNGSLFPSAAQTDNTTDDTTNGDNSTGDDTTGSDGDSSGSGTSSGAAVMGVVTTFALAVLATVL